MIAQGAAGRNTSYLDPTRPISTYLDRKRNSRHASDCLPLPRFNDLTSPPCQSPTFQGFSRVIKSYQGIPFVGSLLSAFQHFCFSAFVFGRPVVLWCSSPFPAESARKVYGSCRKVPEGAGRYRQVWPLLAAPTFDLPSPISQSDQLRPVTTVSDWFRL